MELMLNLENLDMYKDKKILITGNTGFKGVWLSRILTLVGAKVYGLALYPEKNSLYDRLQNISMEKQFIIDVRNQKEIDAFFEKNAFDGIFHLAAQPLVLDSYAIPVETFEVNFNGSINIVNSILKFKSSSWIIMVTTDKVYKITDDLKSYSESDALGGQDPYSASKAAVELAISVWRNYFLKMDSPIGIVSVRAGNVIGGGDNAKHRLLPDIFRSISNNSKLKIRNPNSIRPWQHVLEPISGYLMVGIHLINDQNTSPAYNFGPSIESKLRVYDVAEYVFKKLNRSLKLIEIENNELYEAEYLWLDSSLAQQELGWKRKLSVYQSIDWTIEWEQESLAKHPLEILDSQIEGYFG